VAEVVAVGCLVLLVVGFVAFVAFEVWRARQRGKQVLFVLREKPDQLGLDLGKQFGLGVTYVTLHQLKESGLVRSRFNEDGRLRFRLTTEGEALVDAWGSR
jgi:DNA-binding PadR family transcriptional regulator